MALLAAGLTRSNGVSAAGFRRGNAPPCPSCASPRPAAVTHVVARGCRDRPASTPSSPSPRAPWSARRRRSSENVENQRRDTTTAAFPSSSAATVASNLFPYVGWICVVYSWGTLTWYHWKLYHRKEDAVTGTLSGPNMEARRKWVAAYAKSKKDVITAVQALRNGLLIATANSSICIALISVCLGPLLDAYVRGAFPILGELLLFPFPVLLNVLKFSILFGLLVAQLVCFTQCCYYWVHMTFMLPVVCSSDNETVVSEEGLVDIALHAQFFWWWGYRCLYLLIPAIVWVVVGTLPFAVVSSLMVIALNYLDRPLQKARPLEYYL